MYLAFPEPHFPLQAPPEYIAMYPNIEDPQRRIYSAMVTEMDDSIKVLVDTLEEEEMYDNSIIIFMSDNGGMSNVIDLDQDFSFDYSFTFNASGSNWPLRGVKSEIWEGGTRSPAFIHSPLLWRTGETIDNLIHISDWFPTLLHAADVPVCTRNELARVIDGKDQYDMLFSGLFEWPARTEMLYNIVEPVQAPFSGNYFEAVRVGDWKLVARGNDVPRELYNVAWDESETTDLVEKLPFLVDYLEGRLQVIWGICFVLQKP